MNVHKTDDFIADVERQFEWYAVHAGWDVADGYLAAVEATWGLLSQHPLLGPRGGFSHPRLRQWRFLLVFRPFNKNILFYEVLNDNVVLRRAILGQRDLPHRLLGPPG